MIDRFALVVARRTLEAVTAGEPPPPVPELYEGAVPARVFVSIRVDGALRGCVGDTTGTRRFDTLIVAMTEAAARRDPRFPPIGPGEIHRARIEITRLTEPVPMTVPDIVIGRHGIVVSQPGHRGILLPSVATEFGCEPNEFVELACQKAGLPPTMAGNPALTIHGFEVEVIAE